MSRYILRALERQKHDDEVDSQCVDAERRFYEHMHIPDSDGTATYSKFSWMDQREWSFIFLDYVQHVGRCDNGFHKAIRLEGNPASKDLAARYQVRLVERQFLQSTEWVPFGQGLMIRRSVLRRSFRQYHDVATLRGRVQDLIPNPTAWLEEPHDFLDGRTPASLMKEGPEGRSQVGALLDSIEYGGVA